jgi:hypothetical protein
MIQLNADLLSRQQDPSNGLLPSSSEIQDGNSFQKALTASLSANMPKSGIDPSALPLATPSNLVVNAKSAEPVTPATLPVPPTADDSSGDSTQSFDDAYWAAQPTAVQALRNMDNYDQRSQLAAQLSAQGYNIDVPIMVYGWDPAKITAARESYGYTWVPSAMQNPVAEAPGITAPGGNAYDPNNPPSGSIAV